VDDFKPKINHFATEEIAAVAFAAYRANDNNLYKEPTVYDIDTDQWIKVATNKQIIRQHLLGEALVTVTDQDRVNAHDAKELVIEWCVMQTLQESPVTPFLAALKDGLMQTANPLTACGLFAHLPEQYTVISKKKHNSDKLNQLVYTSDWFGSVGTTLDFTITVIDSKFVPKFSCYHVFGHTPDGNCVGFFTSKENCRTSGNFIGKVKSHMHDQWRNNVKITNFNFVKKSKNIDMPANES
jgi:hypothetical protein